MPDSTIDEIKRRLDVVDVISQTVQLKRAGKGFKGLCPFHGEKTPSFWVTPERGTWHCFGCGEGGDIFSFIQKRDNLDFREALRFLGERAGVDVEPVSRPDPTVRQERDRLLSILESAALYYRATLASDGGEHARAYLVERGLRPETVERFGLGFGDSQGRGLERHLTRAGFTVEESVKAGALGQSEDGRIYDRFRDRVIFPIRDADGQAIGFGGRALRADQQPKYLNSPQTDLFDKGGNLYALDQARDAIRKQGQAIVVEGYMDALIAHQAGFTNVVATLGTAITERHVQVLRRLAPEIVLALDADAAGQRATLRGYDVARESLADESPTIVSVRGLGRFFGDRRTQVKAMVLPAGRDPDDVIRADPDLWRGLAGRAQPIVDVVLDGLKSRHDLGSLVGRREAAREAMSVIQDLPDPVERAHYIQRLGQILEMREELLLQAAETRPRRAGATAPQPPPREPAADYDEQLQDLVVTLLLRASSVEQWPDPVDFESAVHRAILDHLQAGPAWPDVPTALDRLEAGLGGSVHEVVERLRTRDAENERLTPDEVIRELQVRRLELRKQRLFRQHQALDSAFREEAESLGAAERHEFHERLAQLATSIGEAIAEQSKLGVVGTASWSIRRGQEVLGG